MYISWCSICHIKNEISDFHTIFDCLLNLSTVVKNNFQTLIFSALHNCLKTYFILSGFKEPKKALKYLKEFFSLNFIFPTNSFDLIEIALEAALKSSKDIHSDDDLSELILYIGILCEEKKKSFPNSVAEKIAIFLMLSFSKLEISPLNLFSHLSQHLLQQTNIRIFSVFGNSIWHCIIENEPFIKSSIAPKYKNDEENQHFSAVEVTLRFWDKTRFVNGVNLKTNILFPERVVIESFLPDVLSKKLRLIISAANDDEQLIIILLETLAAVISTLKNDKYVWDLSLVYLYCCTHFYNHIRKSDCELLLSPPFFSPTQTLFNNGEDFQFISSIRSAAIQTMLKSPNGLAEIILSHWMKEPQLFAEITHRIIANRQLLNFNNRSLNNFCKALMTASLYYQQIHYQAEEEEAIESIEIARTSLFLLISSLLNTVELVNLFWSNHFFTSFYLSFLFEVPLQTFVLSHLLSYLSKKQTDIPNVLLDILQQIMQICFPSFPSEKFVVLVTDILATLNDALIHQRAITKYFEPFCSLFFSSFSSVGNSPSMQNYILQCIQFFSLVATPKELGVTQFVSLNESITKAFGSTIPTQLSNKLIQLIAGDNLASLTPAFFIRHPKAAQMLVHVSKNDNKIIEYIDFIKALIVFSNSNAFKLRESDFDIYLIDCIKELNDGEKLDAFLSLFHQISTVISSVSVVQRYISLLSPFDGKYYSDYQDKYIRTMSNIISTSLRLPSCSLRMNSPDGSVDIVGLTHNEIEKGFTFVCWVQLDSPKALYKPNLLRIQDSKGNSISVFISASYLFCEQKTAQYASTGKVELQIPKSNWSFIAFTLSHDSEINFMTPYYGIKPLKSLEYMLMSFHPGPITCKVAGVTPDSSSSDIISRMSTFGIFPPLNSDSIAQLYQIGPRGSGYLPINPICFFTSEEDNGFLVLNSRSTPHQIEAKLHNKDIECDLTFTEVLGKFCKVQMLLPLFDQIEMTTRSGVTFPIEKMTIELFSNMLSTSSGVQESFCSCKGVNIISNLLYSVSIMKIDYALYLQFYSLVQSISNETLQTQFIKEILLDCELWMRTDSENHLRIIKHWDRTLFPSMITLLSTMFQHMLYIMRAYYWYNLTKEEQEYIKCPLRTRNETLNVSECRQLLSRIAVLIATQKFTQKDFNCITSHCLTCVEQQQVVDLLQLIRSLGLADPCPLASISENHDFVSFLYSLLPRRNYHMLCLIFEVIITFYKRGLIEQPSLQDQISSIMNQLSPSRISTDFFFRCIESVQSGYYELFPVCCWMANNEAITEDQALLMLSQLRPKPEFVTHSTWCFWPLVLCFKTQSFIVKIQMLSFIISCNFSIWGNIYAMIYNVEIILKINGNEIKSLLLHCISKKIETSNEPTMNNVAAFFMMAKRYLLFKQKDNENLLLRRYFEDESPFAPSMPLRLTNSPDFEKIDQIDLKNNFNSSLSNEINFSYNNFAQSIDNNDNSYSPEFTNDNDVTDNEIEIEEDYNSNREIMDNSDNYIYHNRSVEYPSQRRNNYSSFSSTTGSLNIRPRIMCSSVPYFTGASPESHKNKRKTVRSNSYSDNDDIKNLISSTNFKNEDLVFGIKIDADGNWIDEELAEVTISVFREYPLKNFLSFDLILCSFLLHYQPDNVINHIKNLSLSYEELSSCQAYSDLFIHHCELVKRKSIFQPSQNYNSNIFKSLQKMEMSLEGDLKPVTKRMFKILKNEFSDTSIQKIVEHFSFHLDEIIGESRQQMLHGKERDSQYQQQNRYYWSRLWRSLAVDPAPWSANLGFKAHYKRDSTACAFGCPFKLKRNWHFNDHSSATFTLDSDLNHNSSNNSGNDKNDNKLDLPVPTLTREAHQKLINKEIESKKNINSSTQLIEISGENESQVSDLRHALYSIPCILVRPDQQKNGTFALFKNRIEMRMEEGRSKKVVLTDIIHILFRNYLHRPTALEIFTTMGKSYFINFPYHKSIPIIRSISSLGLPNARNVQILKFQFFFNQHGLKVLWQRNQISNFEYLMHLNMMSGRSFNDLSQYPIFPWILCNYATQTLDMSDSSLIRDLKKPIGALNEERLRQLIEKHKKGMNYLYSSGPSCMLHVCNYLVRVEPFTSLHIKLQNGKFAHPCFIFRSIEEAFNESYTRDDDFCEIQPEFFYDFDFLENKNHYNFGNTIDNVLLPKWANNSTASFIYMMRKALESDYVSQTLNHWIDLIWGYKQRGPDSLCSYNVFAPELYESVWNENPMSPERIKQIEASLHHLGQIPPQLFTKPHPAKNIADSLSKPFQQPFTIPSSKTRSISLARFEIVGNWKFRIMGIDSNGIMITHFADFTHRQPKSNGLRRSQPTLINPDGLSMSTSISDTTVTSMEDEDLKGIGLTAVAKEIKGFNELNIDIFARSNLATHFGMSKIAVVSKQSNRLYLVDISKGIVESVMTGVTGVAAYEDYLAVCKADAVLNIYKTSLNNQLHSMPSYGDSISCCCINGKFFVVIIGTCDGKLIINSLNKGNIVRVIDLHGAKPNLVTVTNGWGFIVCYAQKFSNGKLKHRLFVYSINGELIRKKKIDFEIVVWTTWTSNKAFDYMAVADGNGKLYAFEVFYCDIGERLYRCRSKIATMIYMQDICCISAVTKDARILFVPYEIY